MLDDKGRTRRWVVKQPEVVFTSQSFCCAKYNPSTDHENDLYFVKAFAEMEQSLFGELEVHSRAISNWKKIRLLLVLMRIAKGKLVMEENEDEEEIDIT